jgi:DNA-binding transcriptional MerR regulator
MTPPDDRRTITATEAARTLGIPSGTVRSWASRQLIFAVAIGRDGQKWYRLDQVLALAGRQLIC